MLVFAMLGCGAPPCGRYLTGNGTVAVGSSEGVGTAPMLAPSDDHTGNGPIGPATGADLRATDQPDGSTRWSVVVSAPVDGDIPCGVTAYVAGSLLFEVSAGLVHPVSMLALAETGFTTSVVERTSSTPGVVSLDVNPHRPYGGSATLSGGSWFCPFGTIEPPAGTDDVTLTWSFDPHDIDPEDACAE